MRHDGGMTTDPPLSILVIPGALRARSMNRALAHAAVGLAPPGAAQKRRTSASVETPRRISSNP